MYQACAHERSLANSWLRSVHIDPTLFVLLSLLVFYGLVVLFSAVSQSGGLFEAQLVRLSLAFVALFIAAQLPPRLYVRWAPSVYLFGVALLVLVLVFGVTVKGSQRWLEIPGLVR